jgi:FkbM family methyltransferase
MAEAKAQAAGSYRSQNGEDRWLETRLGARREGFYVEVGAYDGVQLSNSYHFEQLGWRGVLVEPDPAKAEQCRRNRPGARTCQCAAVGPEDGDEIVFHQVSGGEVYSTTELSAAHRERLDKLGFERQALRVPARTLDSILEEAPPPAIDFVSIDVEGGELRVLRGFDIRRWRPAVVLVETNARVRDAAIREYFLAAGYAYLRSIDVNDFYVPLAGSAAWRRSVDGARYLRHRAARRLRRWGQLARRAWRKHVLGSRGA